MGGGCDGSTADLMGKSLKIILVGPKRKPQKRDPRTEDEEEEIKAGCDGKVQHKSYLAADYYTTGTTMQVYECKFCGFWHVGHKHKKKNG